MDHRTAAALLLSACLAAAVAGCSGVTDRGKEAPACKGELRPLNPEEFEGGRENDFNDLHRGVRPPQTPGQAPGVRS